MNFRSFQRSGGTLGGWAVDSAVGRSLDWHWRL